MIIGKRYDFVVLMDVVDGNPNGDPDAGNLPRIDAETGMGLMTDVCLKRKIRNYVGVVHQEKPPYEIYIKEKAILNNQNKRAYVGIGAEVELEQKEDKKRQGGDRVEEARAWMCSNFYDVRAFGAVMSTGVNCGQVRGPVQLTFARSVDPVVTLEHSITRMAVATEKEAVNQDGDNRTMGRKFTVPYGLYRAHGFVSAHLAKQTGFSDTDLKLLWDAIKNMFEHDRTAARGMMSTRGLYVFEHDNELGNALAQDLFQRIRVEKKCAESARSFSDYEVSIDITDLNSVKLHRIVG